MKILLHKVSPTLLLVAGLFVIFSVVKYAVDGYLETNDPTGFPSNTSGALSNAPKISLADVCDCYLVTWNINPYLVIDSTTGQFVDFPPITKGQDETTSREPFIHSSGTRFAAITESGKEIEYRSGVLGTTKKVYSAPDRTIINWLTWAGNSETILFGMGREEDLRPAEGSHPTQIVALNLASGATTTIISESMLATNNIDEIFPLASTNNATKILLSSGGMEEQKFWTWTASKGLQLLEDNFIGSIYFATAQTGEQTKFLTYYEGLHVFDVDAETEIVYPMTGWSDSPVSQPSPDGKYVVYLKQDETASRGFPTILSLEDGQERRLTNNAVGDKGSMAGSFWSPDGKRFAFSRDYSKPAEYSVVDTQQVNQTPKLLELPTTLGDNTIYRLIPKN